LIRVGSGASLAISQSVFITGSSLARSIQ